MRGPRIAVGLLLQLLVIQQAIMGGGVACPMASGMHAEHMASAHSGASHRDHRGHSHDAQHCNDSCLPGACTMSSGCGMDSAGVTSASLTRDERAARTPRPHDTIPESFLGSPEPPPPRA